MKYLRKLNIKLVKGEYQNPVKGQVRLPEQVYEVFKDIKDQAVETLIGVYLTESLEVVTYDVLSVGGEDATLVLPEEIFGRSFVTRTRTFILIHNHPQGDPQPSADDQRIMKVLRKQSQTLNKRFLDFIIVGDGQYWSMFEDLDGGERPSDVQQR